METLLNFDATVFHLINGWDLGFLDTVLVISRNKFIWIPLYVAIVVYMAVRWKKQSWLPILFSVLTVVCSDGTSSHLIKKTVERPRPCHTLEQINLRVKCGSGYSFTSSHATSHMALAVFWVQLFTFWGRHRWWFLPWAIIIGFAQIFVGVHYPLDVLSGFVVGAIVGWGVFRAYRGVFQKKYPKVRV